MPLSNRHDYLVIDLIQQAVRNIKAQPVNLGGVSGPGGGDGGPPGGFIGQLVQTEIAYDTTEASSPLTVGSGSLVDNLNHIRYRLQQLEAGSGVLVVEQYGGSPSINLVDKIIFSGAIVTDLGNGDALVAFTGGGGSDHDHHFYTEWIGPVRGTYQSPPPIFAVGVGERVWVFDTGVGLSGDFVGHNNDIAYRTSTGWEFLTPTKEGLIFYLQSDNNSYVWDGDSWEYYKPFPMVVAEADGVPTVTGVHKITFSGAVVTDLGSGEILVAVSGGAGGGDSTYLRLDATNDPLTGKLSITPASGVDVLYLEGTGETYVADIEQFAYNDETLTTPTMFIYRGPGDASSPDFGAYMIEVLDDAPASLSTTGGFLKYTFDSINHIALNPRMTVGGCAFLFNSYNNMAGGGIIFSIQGATEEIMNVTYSGIRMPEGKSIELGVNALKETNAGKIGYEIFSVGELAIVGAGTSAPNRKVRIYDKLYVDNALNVGGTDIDFGKLVTNGDGHDHNGGDGAQISYSNLSNKPTLREVLTANRTYYVRTDGSDSNDGLTNNSGGAFLTIQKAINTVAQLDLAIYNVTIQLGDGTYTAGASVQGTWVGSGNVTIAGNSSTPGNVIISVTSGHCIYATQGGRIRVQDLELRTTTSGIALAATVGAYIAFGNIRFGAVATYHIYATGSSTIETYGDYAITGGAPRHISAESGSYVRLSGITVTLTGTPNFSGAFAVSTLSGALLMLQGNTYIGSATGVRYQAALNSVIYVQGAGANYLPGNAAGSTSSGGQYS